MSKWRSKWVKKKVDIAASLNNGELDGGYAEGVIMLCAVISALSAEVWPGRKIDQKRFSELIERFGKIEPSPSIISIPLLIGYLRPGDYEKEADELQHKFMGHDKARVLTGYDVDQEEREVVSVCSAVPLDEIRKFSYANVLYQEVRCNYMHQYHSGDKADPWPMTSDDAAKISYGNWVDDPNRHIHFHFDWIKDLTLKLAGEVDDISGSIPSPLPSKWWLDG